MSKISLPTKSFIILFGLAIFVTFFCLQLSSEFPEAYYSNYYNLSYHNEALKTPKHQQIIKPVVDTSAWKTYTNQTLGFSFKYKPDWKILPVTQKDGYNIIQIDPGAKFYNIKIYVSKEDYYVMNGLPYEMETIDGQRALNVNDFLYGIKYSDYFYTFDIGLSLSLKDNFDALVNSVKFGQ